MDILGVVSGLAGQSRYKVVRSDLRSVGWFDVPGLFRFGYPWPWEDFGDGAGYAGASGEVAAEDLLGALRAPRSQGMATAVVWRSRGSLRSLEPSADVRFARLYGGVHRGIRRMRADGAPVLAIDVDLPGGDRVTRGVVGAPGDHVVHLELRAPGAAAAGYRPHLDAMLASWSWG